MMRRCFAVLGLVACGGDEPIDVLVFGEPTILVVANPEVNEANQAQMPEPGLVREGIDVELDTGLAALTDAGGLAVLSPVPSGSRTLTLTNGVDGQLVTPMGERELREIGVAVDRGAEAMIVVDYDFTRSVVELTPATPVGEIEAALAASDTIVVFRAGTYVVGDLEISGSGMTVFGEGIETPTVLIDGTVTVRGSGNRIRGAQILGDLVVSGSDAGVAFTTVLGRTTITGSDTRLLYNAFCAPVDVSGSGLAAIGNAGLSPIAPVCP